MAQSRGSGADGASAALGVRLLRFAMQRPPRRFAVPSFGNRLCQHLLVYAAIVIGAIYACLFVAVPVETGAISVICLAVAGVAVALYPRSRRKPQRLLEGGVAAGYIVGAAAILKAFESLLYRM